MAYAPTGTVTVLFTDLVGSTELQRKLGDDGAEALRRVHFGLLREAFSGQAGREVKNLGDGLMVAFPSALDALACAIAMQQGVHRHNEASDSDHQLHVRVGLQVGEPVQAEGDYFGTPVVTAGRLCDEAQGGQILTSSLLRALVGGRGGHAFRDIGQLELKGIDEPLAACEVVWEPSAAPAASGIERLPLPAPLAGTFEATFVGRQQERQALLEAWERAQDGVQLALIAGEPGIGKTRLASELARRAHDEGAAVLYGRCDEDAASPYQPFLQALSHLERAPAAAGRVGSLAARAIGLFGDPAASGQDEAIGRVLAELAPAGFVLDDLQWADRPALQVLRQIVRSHEGSLLIIGTFRDEGLGRKHPLSEALADLRRDTPVERIALEGLAQEQVGALIDAWVGRPCTDDLRQAVHQHTEGNPFFVEEVLRDLEERGAVYERDGHITTDLTDAQLGIPEGITEVIGRRLARLSDDCNSVLTIAAVVGREFGVEAVERASDLPLERLLELLEEAVGARVIAEVAHSVGRYVFSHSLIYETLYAELTTTRRVRLHGQTLQYADSGGTKIAFEELGASGPHVVAVGISNCPAGRPRNLTIAQHWDRISQYCRLILYDRRGLGSSAAPTKGYSVQGSVGDLAAVLDAAGAQRAILWGAADGGPLAIAFAAQHADRVAGLLLLGTSAKFTNAPDFELGVSQQVLESFLSADSIDRDRATSQAAGTRHRSEDARAITEILHRVPEHAWPKLLGGIASADARELLPRIRVPTLIIQHPHNDYIPVQAAHYLHEQIRGSDLEITEEYRAPLFGEACYRRIAEFIEDVARRGAR